MAEQQPIKFTDEEMTELTGIRQKYVDIQNALGQTSVAKIRLEQQLDELHIASDKLQGDFIATQTAEQQFVATISKKYGDGTLNPDSGEFTPNPVK